MRKFKVPVMPDTTTKCIRFPDEMIEKIEQIITGKRCTFSAFVIEAVRVALEAVEREEKL